MRNAIIFVLGLALGAAVATKSQVSKIAGMNGVNHIGLSVDNFDESVAFYEQKMGFHEVDRIHNDKGETVLVFVQVSRDTFLELAPSNANRPAGLTHFGCGRFLPQLGAKFFQQPASFFGEGFCCDFGDCDLNLITNPCHQVGKPWGQRSRRFAFLEEGIRGSASISCGNSLRVGSRYNPKFSRGIR